MHLMSCGNALGHHMNEQG